MSDRPATFARIGALARSAFGFAGFAWRRYSDDHCLATAGALSYTSLLAIVPLLAVFLSILRIFPFFAEMQADVEQQITGVLMPTESATAIENLHSFIDKAANLTGFGVIGLAVTAVLLLNTINHSFSGIWRVGTMRPLVVRFLAYWAILTLGPLLFGLAMWMSGEIYAAGTTYGGGAFSGAAGWVAPLVPLLLEAGGFALLYIAVPNCRVRRWDAIAGGLTAALLFEMLKRVFALYVIYFPTYQVIYGAIAAVPIFLVWMYASWAVTLFGAEVAAALPEWRKRERENTTKDAAAEP